MPRKLCAHCGAAPAALKRPKTFEQARGSGVAAGRSRRGQSELTRAAAQICKECFYTALETEVHRTIVDNRLFAPGEVVAMGASGGKDSTVLIHILSTLNARYKCALADRAQRALRAGRA